MEARVTILDGAEQTGARGLSDCAPQRAQYSATAGSAPEPASPEQLEKAKMGLSEVDLCRVTQSDQQFGQNNRPVFRTGAAALR